MLIEYFRVFISFILTLHFQILWALILPVHEISSSSTASPIYISFHFINLKCQQARPECCFWWVVVTALPGLFGRGISDKTFLLLSGTANSLPCKSEQYPLKIPLDIHLVLVTPSVLGNLQFTHLQVSLAPSLVS